MLAGELTRPGHAWAPCLPRQRYRHKNYNARNDASSRPTRTEIDASYYSEDLPVAAYQPVVTNVLQPLEHAGEDGDTEAAGGGGRRRRGKQMSGGTRQRAKRKAAREAAQLLSAASDGDTDGG